MHPPLQVLFLTLPKPLFSAQEAECADDCSVLLLAYGGHGPYLQAFAVWISFSVSRDDSSSSPHPDEGRLSRRDDDGKEQ